MTATGASVAPLPGDPVAVPLALARLHAELPVGAEVDLDVPVPGPTDDPALPGAADLAVGGGFEVVGVRGRERAGRVPMRLVRARTLADTVGPGMRLLVCGLNPSVYAADAGVGFARPGNRFWPAAIAAGLVGADRDPVHALTVDRVGMTDLVKRATPRADALDPAEYRVGLERVGRLARWLAPGAVCFVGLAGWRSAVDRRASAGRQPVDLGGRPVYVMPSTSGLNASSHLDDLAAHLHAAAALADGEGRAGRRRGATAPSRRGR